MMKDNQTKTQILIADDEHLIRDILSRKLTENGYKCINASNGIDALKQLDTYQIDLVLLDITMPGKSGIEVLQDIRIQYPDTAVIMVTAMAEVETAINAMRLGAYDYIIKPVDQKLLLLSIDRALERRRLIMENEDYQRNLERKIAEQTRKIRESFLNAIKSLAYALEAKDLYTSGHSQRTTEISIAIAQELALPEETVEKIRLAGLLHDIGKIGLRESVLNKSGELTDEDFEHVKMHSEIGEHILSPIIEDAEILEMVRHHHERYDGKGYPDGIQAGQLSRGSQILAVADAYANLSQGALILAVSDAYDAMTSDRPYRKAMTPDTARSQLEMAKGTQFDPEILDAFFKLLDAGKIK